MQKVKQETLINTWSKTCWCLARAGPLNRCLMMLRSKIWSPIATPILCRGCKAVRAGGREEEFMLAPKNPPKRAWGNAAVTGSWIHQGQELNVTAVYYWQLAEKAGWWKTLRLGGRASSQTPPRLAGMEEHIPLIPAFWGKERKMKRFLSLLQKYLPIPH